MGCVAYYRVFDLKWTKLRSRAIKSVLVGYAENSKAYWLLDLESNVFVESRDVKFFKNKFINDSINNHGQEPIQDSSEFEPSTSTNQKHKSVETINEIRTSQRVRKQKSSTFDFVSPNDVLFLVEGSRGEVPSKIPIVLNPESEPRTFK